MPTLPYTLLQSETARRGWKAACGHHSIAATGLSLESILAASVVEGIPLKGWMNPTMIFDTLDALPGITYLDQELQPPPPLATSAEITTHRHNALGGHSRQILRLQFEGTWMAPHVPAGARYQRTHYIALLHGFIMDPLIDAQMLIPVATWLSEAHAGGPAYLAETSFKGTTGWHFTHAWRITS